MVPTLATIAHYYRFGIEAGVCTPDEARAWTLSVIEELDEPPYEIIEASWIKPRAQLIDDLKAVPGEVDLQCVGKWLLAVLRDSMPSTNENLARTVHQAMQIVRATGLGDDLYYVFDALEDDLHYVGTEGYWDAEDCRNDLDQALAEYNVPPFDFRSSGQ